MAYSEGQVSSQCYHDYKTAVTIVEVKSPAHYVVKESAGVNSSLEAKLFAQAESKLQEFFHLTELPFFPMPLKDTIVVVSKNNKFYRGRVVKIISMSEGYLIRVYLVDYGYECSVPRNCMWQIPEQFLKVPFQAVELKLDNIKPITLVMDPTSLEMSYGAVDDWDPSALGYVNELKEGMVSAYMTVRKVGKDLVNGSLFMTFQDDPVKCINDELVLKKYAQYEDLDAQSGDNSVSCDSSENLQSEVSNSSETTDDEVKTPSLDTAFLNNHARLSRINELMSNRKTKGKKEENAENVQATSSSPSEESKSIKLTGSQIIPKETEEECKASQHSTFTEEVPIPANSSSEFKLPQMPVNPLYNKLSQTIKDMSDKTISIAGKGNNLIESPEQNELSENSPRQIPDKPFHHSVASPSNMSSSLSPVKNSQESSLLMNDLERRSKSPGCSLLHDNHSKPSGSSPSLCLKGKPELSSLNSDAVDSCPLNEKVSEDDPTNTTRKSAVICESNVPLSPPSEKSFLFPKEEHIPANSHRHFLRKLQEKMDARRTPVTNPSTENSKPLNALPLSSSDRINSPKSEDKLDQTKSLIAPNLENLPEKSAPSTKEEQIPANSHRHFLRRLQEKMDARRTPVTKPLTENSQPLNALPLSLSDRINSPKLEDKLDQSKTFIAPNLKNLSEKTVPTPKEEQIPANSHRHFLRKLQEKMDAHRNLVTKPSADNGQLLNATPLSSSKRIDSPQLGEKSDQSKSHIAPNLEKSGLSSSESNNVISSSPDNAKSSASSEEESHHVKALGKTEFNSRNVFKPKMRIDIKSPINRKTEGVKSLTLEEKQQSDLGESEIKQHTEQEVISDT